MPVIKGAGVRVGLGRIGYTGSAGTAGFTGSSGAAGVAGSPGGYSGSQGYSGSVGGLGYTGSAGAGYTGSAGAVGYTGSKGDLGTVGFTKKHFEPIMDAVEVPMLSSGHSDAPTGPMIIHGRNATSDVNLLNTHPFRKKGWALVHNGVVDMPLEPEDFEEEKRTPDVEQVEKRLTSSGVADRISNIINTPKELLEILDMLLKLIEMRPNTELIGLKKFIVQYSQQANDESASE